MGRARQGKDSFVNFEEPAMNTLDPADISIAPPAAAVDEWFRYSGVLAAWLDAQEKAAA